MPFSQPDPPHSRTPLLATSATAPKPLDRLAEFVRESNAIEGIHRPPRTDEVAVHDEFLKLPEITIHDLKDVVRILQPGATIRTEPGMNVRIGSHRPPPGSPLIREQLLDLLADIRAHAVTPYEAHQDYEHLHPFMDGNGRSGRLLWAWHMCSIGQSPFALPFLQRWYYQSLDAGRHA